MDVNTTVSWTPAFDAALARMRTAGADAFNRGAPNVPGLDILWERELYGNCASGFAIALARDWRFGWKAQAALVERVGGRRCTGLLNDSDPPYIRPCVLQEDHTGEHLHR